MQVLDARKLTFLPRACATVFKCGLLPGLAFRIDTVITSRLPVRPEDAVECLFGLQMVADQKLTARWKLFTERMISEGNQNSREMCMSAYGLDPLFVSSIYSRL